MPFHLALEHLIAVKSLFSEVVDHAMVTERAYFDTYGGGSKMPYQYYSGSGIPFGG